MPTTLPTFSALPRAFRCRLSTVLAKADHANEDAAAGQARHKFLEIVSILTKKNVPIDEAKASALDLALPAHRPMLDLIPLDSLQLEGVATEVAVAIEVRTGTVRELGRGLERDYSLALPTEVVGTIDRLALRGADAAYVGDYKGRSHVANAMEDEQLVAGAYAASRLFGRRRVDVEVIRIIDGEPYHSGGRLEPFDLDSFFFRLQAVVERIGADRVAASTGDLPPAVTGPWCRWCPSLAYCPAKMALARAVLGGDSQEIAEVVKKGQTYITKENAPRLHLLVAEAERILKAVKISLQDYARVQPFELADGTGRWYGVPPDYEERDIPDGRKAAKVLEEVLGVEPAQAGIKVEVSLTGVEAAVKAWIAEDKDGRGGRGAITRNVERLVEILTKRGLLRIVRGGVVRPYRPKEA